MAASKKATAKPNQKKETAKADPATKPGKRGDDTDRLLKYAGGGAAAFVALLVGTAHMLKRARRAARRRGAHLEADGPPGWVLTEAQILAIAGGLVVLVVAGVVFALLGERLSQQWEAWREVRRERERRLAAQAGKLAQQEARKTGAVLSADLAVRRAATDAAERAEADAHIARTRAGEAQLALERAQQSAGRAADDQAARKAAVEIDARTRAAAAAAAAEEANSAAAQYTLDAWDVEEEGDKEEGEEAEGEGEEEQAPRMKLELHPVARGTEVCSQPHGIHHELHTPSDTTGTGTLGNRYGDEPPEPMRAGLHTRIVAAIHPTDAGII